MPNSRTHLDWYPLELVSYYTITRPSTNSGMLLYWYIFFGDCFITWVKGKWSSISLGFLGFICLFAI